MKRGSREGASATLWGSAYGSPGVIQFADLAEMMPIDRKRNSQREHLRPAKKSPEQDLPILESLFANNTQADT